MIPTCSIISRSTNDVVTEKGSDTRGDKEVIMRELAAQLPSVPLAADKSDPAGAVFFKRGSSCARGAGLPDGKI